MTRSPPPSDSEPDIQEYQYESDGEEQLGNSARQLFQEARGNYRLARAALLAYTRDDRVYISSSPAPIVGDSQRSTPSCVATSSGTLPSHLVPRTLQANDPTKVRFLTPPPTPAPARNPSTSSTATRHVTPAPRRKGGGVSPLKGQEYRPALISRQNPHCYTSIYPLLAEAEMLGYFGMEYGVSKRPPEDIREMLKQIKLNQFWLGGMDYVNTAAATSVQQEIHAPAVNTSARRWYNVSMGTEVGIFTSWTVTATYVLGVSNAAHRSFDTKEEAFCSFQYALLLGTVELLPLPPSSHRPSKPRF